MTFPSSLNHKIFLFINISLIGFLTLSCGMLGSDSSPAVDASIAAVDAPASAAQGDTVHIDVTVENTSEQEISENITVTLENQTEEVTISSQRVTSLAAADTAILTFSWETGEVSPGEYTFQASHNLEDDNPNNNSRSASVTITEPQENDIAITGLNSPSSAEQGDEIDIEVTVENSGNQVVEGEFDVILEDHTDGTTVGTQTVSSLEQGASVTLTYTWNTGEASAGEHEIGASHTFDDDNGNNNSVTAAVSINEPAVTDIAIGEVNAPSSAEQGEEINIEVTVENTGDQTIENEVDVTLEDQTDGITIGTQTVSGLEAGASATLVYVWDTGEASSGEHELEAFHEFDDANNDNNSETTTVTINEPAVTDIAITEMNAPSSVTQGQTADIEVTITNTGNTDVSETITVTFMHHQETLGTRTIENGLDAGGSATVSYGWDTTGEGTGEPAHPIDAFHDFNDDDDSNDEDTVEILVEEP